MLKSAVLSLIVATTFAQAETWDQMIASKRTLPEMVKALPKIEDAYNKAILKEIPSVTQKSIDGIPDASELLTISALKNNGYIGFYLRGSEPYYDKARESLKGKSAAEAQNDESYKSFRPFIVHSQRDSKLHDVLADVIVNDKRSLETLLPALLRDPDSDLRDTFAKAFWRRLATPADSAEEYYDIVKVYMENAPKEDLLRALKAFDRTGFLSGEMGPCNPQFWTVARLLTGDQKIGKDVIDDRLFDLADPKKLHKEVTVEDGNHRDRFFEKSEPAADKEEDRLEERKLVLQNSNPKAGVIKVFGDDWQKHINERARIQRAAFGPDNVNEDIKNCTAAKKIRDLSNEELKKLTTDSVYKKKFWSGIQVEPSLPRDLTQPKAVPAPDGAEEDSIQWLQQTINYMVNRNSSADTAKAGHKVKE